MKGNAAFEPVLTIDPFSGGGWQLLFRTHPPTEARVSKLREIAQQQQDTAFAVK